MTRVAIDDHITVVYPSMTLCLVVEKVERKVFYCNAENGLDVVSGLVLGHEDEGVFWIRGWHTPDSPEVKAAQAAYGIGDPQERKTRPTYMELAEQVETMKLERARAAQREQEALLRRQQENAGQRWPTQSGRGVGRERTPSDEAWDYYVRGGR